MEALLLLFTAPIDAVRARFWPTFVYQCFSFFLHSPAFIWEVSMVLKTGGCHRAGISHKKMCVQCCRSFSGCFCRQDSRSTGKINYITLKNGLKRIYKKTCIKIFKQPFLKQKIIYNLVAYGFLCTHTCCTSNPNLCSPLAFLANVPIGY